jgi:polyisoprenoid-binding protein YceI
MALAFLSAGRASAATPYAPGVYAVDAALTSVHFRVRSLFGAYEGDFRMPTGGVTIDPRRPGRANVDICFPLEHMTTGDASTDAMLKGGSFFDSAKYPRVCFVAADTPADGGGALRVQGRLTMHGQTRPIAIAARLAGGAAETQSGNPSLRFTGAASVKRSQFGMGFGRPFVSNRVEMTIDAAFRLR